MPEVTKTSCLSYLLALKALFILVATTAVAMQLSDTSEYAVSDWLVPAVTTARPEYLPRGVSALFIEHSRTRHSREIRGLFPSRTVPALGDNTVVISRRISQSIYKRHSRLNRSGGVAF